MLLILDSISGNLNKLLNQIIEFIKENDNEILQYKNIISQKLRPQMQKLIEDSNRLRDKNSELEEIIHAKNT
jgi:hypothetical protein